MRISPRSPAVIALALCAALLLACAGHRYVSGSDIPMADWHQVLTDCAAKPFVRDVEASPVLENLRGYTRVTCVLVDNKNGEAWAAVSFYRLKFQEKNWRRIRAEPGFMSYSRYQECAEVAALPLDANFEVIRDGGAPPRYLVLIFGIWISGLPNECDVRYAQRRGKEGSALSSPAVRR